MFEIDYLPVGDGARSGDAIAMRFTRPDNGHLAHVIIDGGFQDDGDDLVEHVKGWYGTSNIDLVILSHPDGDHIGGLGTVLRKLSVNALAAHDLAAHGGSDLPAAAAVTELRELAVAEGTALYEPFQGLRAFGGALLVAGPSEEFYKARVTEELVEQRRGARAAAVQRGVLAEGLARLSARALQVFPVEIPFEDAGGTNPRNNSSAIIDVQFAEQRFLFTGDAGVPALDAALDFLEVEGRTLRFPTFVDVPHHGSRHNGSSRLLDRLLGPKTNEDRGYAYISIAQEAARDPRYPSPRITNAFGRRGYPSYVTAGQPIYLSGEDAPTRNWTPLTPLPPREESIDDRP